MKIWMYKHMWCDKIKKMIPNLRMHIIRCEHINVCMYLCLCLCVCVHTVKKSLFLLFFLSFSPAECGRWSQAQSDTAIKQHLVEMGWSLLHLWPSGLSVCIGCTMCMCVCVCVCVSYGQHKCWHTVASAGDGANLNSLWEAPKNQENTSAWRCERRRRRKKKIEAAVEAFAVWTGRFETILFYFPNILPPRSVCNR